MGSSNGDRVVPVVSGSLLQFGGHLKELFPQEKEWINMNHGESFRLFFFISCFPFYQKEY